MTMRFEFYILLLSIVGIGGVTEISTRGRGSLKHTTDSRNRELNMRVLVSNPGDLDAAY